MAIMLKCWQRAITNALMVAGVSATADTGDACATLDIGPTNGSTLTVMTSCVEIWGRGDIRSIGLLEQALDYTREDAVLALLRIGVLPTNREEFLIRAAQADLPTVVEFMIEQSVRQQRSAMTNEYLLGLQAALDAAASNGAYRSARLLLDNGADPNSAVGLIEAVTQSNLHIFYLLVERGAQLEKLTEGQRALLFSEAVGSRSWVFVKELLDDHGLDPNMLIDLGIPGGRYHILATTALHEVEWMAEQNWHLLVQYGADPRAMACFFSESDIKDVVEHLPKWFQGEVQRYRIDCESLNTDAPRSN